MALSRREFLKRTGGVAAALGAAQLGSEAVAKAGYRQIDDPEWHLLNRVTYGPRPRELARVREIGAAAFLGEQLDPYSLEDAEADALLAERPILGMDRHTLYSLSRYQHRSFEALVGGMLERAVYSRRQLLERMVDFWTDHFNVPSTFDNNADLVLFQREAVRKHALGNFRQMLIATAKSPAMLEYLDNKSNVAEHPNENYARELLELHTVGVDGGYTETDVKEVARAFTGWTIHKRTGTGFYFREGQHDKGEKAVLGHTLPAGRGIEDGFHVLNILSNHPETARFVSYKLCRRFVSDEPPTALVDELAGVWQANDGEIKPILKALFTSDAFRASQGQKFRRPLEFLIGLFRATGSEVRHFWTRRDIFEELGQPPYGWEPPNGYPDVAGAWLSTNGLLARWNVAMLLTHNANSDGDWGWALSSEIGARTPQVETVEKLVKAVSRQVFGRVMPQDVLEPFIHYASDGAGAQESVTPFLRGRKLASLYGLMLASPQYQWR